TLPLVGRVGEGEAMGPAGSGRPRSVEPLAISARMLHMPCSRRRKRYPRSGFAPSQCDLLLFLSTNAVSGEVARQIEAGRERNRAMVLPITPLHDFDPPAHSAPRATRTLLGPAHANTRHSFDTELLRTRPSGAARRSADQSRFHHPHSDPGQS